MSEEGYKPNEEEIKKAEESMTDEQKIMSESRDEGFEIAQQEQEKNSKEEAIETAEQKLADFVQEMKETARMSRVVDDRLDIFTADEVSVLKAAKLSLMRGDAIDFYFWDLNQLREYEKAVVSINKKLWEFGIGVFIRKDILKDSNGNERIAGFVSASIH